MDDLWPRRIAAMCVVGSAFVYSLFAASVSGIWPVDLKEFLAALTTDMVLLMSGIASLVLAAIGMIKKWKGVPPVAFLVAGLVCFFLSSIRIWTTEHRARLQAEQSLKQSAQSAVPNLTGLISMVLTSPLGEDFGAVAIVTIKNTGAPSVADNYTVTLVGPTRSYEGKFLTAADIHLGRDDGPKPMTLSRNDFLPIKTASNPIPTGGAANGFIPVVFTGIRRDVALEMGAKIEVGFDDIKDNHVVLEFPLKNEKSSRFPFLLPEDFDRLEKNEEKKH